MHVLYVHIDAYRSHSAAKLWVTGAADTSSLIVCTKTAKGALEVPGAKLLGIGPDPARLLLLQEDLADSARLRGTYRLPMWGSHWSAIVPSDVKLFQRRDSSIPL